MARYNAEFEAQIALARRNKRLLVVRSLQYHAPRAEVEAACRTKLSHPDGVRFIWPPGAKPWFQHTGCVMVEFTNRQLCLEGLNELTGLKIRNRTVKVDKASRVSVSVLLRFLLPPS